MLTDGAVTCWGANASGQVGNGDATGADVSSPSPPVALPGGATATAVTALGDATCALLLGGGVSCWGRNGDGEVGSGTVGGVVRTPAAAINLPESAVALAGGFRHACAVLQSGNVFCWGRDSLGQLGNGPASSADAPQYAGPDSLVALPPGRSARAVAAGSSHSCALLDNGAPICWGNDSNGQLGDDGGTGGSITEPALSAPLAGDAAAVALSGGGNNMCALATDGALQCWGSNASGQLGNGTPPGGNSPRPMPALRGFDDIFAEVGSGTAQTCAVLTDGGISCWGNDDSGALGAGTTREDVPSPNPAVALPAPGTASAVTGGTFFACALLTSGGVTCWGDDFEGALGNVGGAVSTPPAPVDLPAPGRAKQIDTGFLFTCALLVDGQVTCWGSGFFGALGNGTIGINALTPPPPIILPPPGAATAIAAGGRHACALLTDGRVSCWGDDTDGQLGNGAPTNFFTSPSQPIALPTTATAIAAGSSHTCALLVGGDVTCWGSDASGQLGNGPGSSNVTAPPAPITLPAPATAIAAGGAFTCALLVGGAITCWGADTSGQVGNGPPNSNVVAPSSAITFAAPATAITAGSAHACARLEDGSATCWGADGSGQIGDGLPEADLSAPSDPLVVPAPLEVSVAPDAPAGVAATAGDRQVALSWTAPADSGSSPVVDYRVEQSVNGGPWSTAIASTARNVGTSATVTGLANGTSYRFRVVGINGQTESPPSAPSAAVAPRTGGGDGGAGEGGGGGAGDVGIVPVVPGRLLETRAGEPTVDVTAYAPAGSIVTPITPARLIETRSGRPTVDTQQAGIGRRAARQVTEVQITGRAGIPNGAAAGVFNITAVNPALQGFITAYACDAPGGRPAASTVNYQPGQTVANGATLALSATGTICIYTHRAMDLVVDVTAWIPASPAITTITPARLVETRPGEPAVDDQQAGIGRRAARQVTEVQVVGRAGVPSGATAGIFNITAINPALQGFITAYPCDAPERPAASMVNYRPGQTVANNGTIALSAAGTICIYTHRAMDLIVDITGHAR